MNQKIVKHSKTGRLYEVHHVVFSTRGKAVDDVFACHALSAYDGMPIGDLQWIPVSEFLPTDVRRVLETAERRSIG